MILLVLTILGPALAVGAQEIELGQWQIGLGEDSSHGSSDIEWRDIEWRDIEVPSPLSTIVDPSGTTGQSQPFNVWYRVSFASPPSPPQAPLGVFLGRIQDIDEVFLNGLYVGSEGIFDRWPVADKARGYRLPLLALTPPGELNELTVRVQPWSPAGGLAVDQPFIGPWADVVERRASIDRQSAVLDIALLAANASSLALWFALWSFGQRSREHRLLGLTLMIFLLLQLFEGLNLYLWIASLEEQLATGAFRSIRLGDLYPFFGLAVWAASPIVLLHYLWAVTDQAVDRRLLAVDGLLLTAALVPFAWPSSRLALDFYLALSSIGLIAGLALWLPTAWRKWRAGMPGIGAVMLGFAVLVFGALVYGYFPTAPVMTRAFSRSTFVFFPLLLLVAFAQRHRSLENQAEKLGGLLIRSTETERERIARDLHDGLAQRLAAHGLSLRLALRSESLEPVRDVVHELTETSHELRSALHQLQPTLLLRFGLEGAVESHCHDVADRHGVTIETRVDGDPVGLPWIEDGDRHLLRMVQEAVANAIRHGDAGHVSVELIFGPRRHWRLTVADDGTGFDPTQPPRPGAMGLSILAERAQQLGGRLEIRRRHPRGMLVTAEGNITQGDEL